MSEKLSDDERGDYEDRILQLQAEIATFAEWRSRLEKLAKSDNAVVKAERVRADQFQDENQKLREANKHYLEVCKENQNLEDELIETKAEIEKLRAVIRDIKNKAVNKLTGKGGD